MRTVHCTKRSRQTLEALLAEMGEVPELASASYLTMNDVRKIRRGALSVDVFGTVHGDGIQRLDKTHFNVIGDGEVSATQVGHFYGTTRAQLTSAGETFVKCGLKTARLIAELRQHKQDTPFPDELGDFPDASAWTLGLELRRNLPASFQKYDDLADLDAKACEGNVVEQTATHSSGKTYTLLYTDGCDGGNAAGLILDNGTPVRLIRDSAIEALPTPVTPALSKAIVRANKEIQNTGALLKKFVAQGTQPTPPTKSEMPRVHRIQQEIQNAAVTEERINMLRKEASQATTGAQQQHVAQQIEADTMKLKLHKSRLLRLLKTFNKRSSGKDDLHSSFDRVAGAIRLAITDFSNPAVVAGSMLVAAPIAYDLGVFDGVFNIPFADRVRYMQENFGDNWQQHVGGMGNSTIRALALSMGAFTGATVGAAASALVSKTWGAAKAVYAHFRRKKAKSNGVDAGTVGGGGTWAAYESAYAQTRAAGASRRASCLAALA